MEDEQQIFSGQCFFCLSKTRYSWCRGCEEDFILEFDRCPICARTSCNSTVCGACLNNRPYFTQTEALFNYRYPANNLIKALKFNRKPELAKQFADKFIAMRIANRKTSLPKALIPVPLHRKRQAQRGYNQSLEFARHLSRKLNIFNEVSLCHRIINTDPQSTLPLKTRKQNVKGAFALTDKPIPKHIAIIDDVITTGSTTNEIARLFKQAGCLHIEVWAIARA